MSERKTIIEIEHLNKTFGDVKAVRDLSFRVKEGELFAFLGVSLVDQTLSLVPFVFPDLHVVLVFFRKILRVSTRKQSFRASGIAVLFKGFLVVLLRFPGAGKRLRKQTLVCVLSGWRVSAHICVLKAFNSTKV